MVALPLNQALFTPPVPLAALDPLQEELFERFGIDVPVWTWPAPPGRLFRVSAQLYNRAEQYQQLAEALSQCERSAAQT